MTTISAAIASPMPPQSPLAFTLEDTEDGYDYTPTYIRQTKEARIKMVMSDIPNKELDESRLWTQEEDQKLRFRNLTYKNAYMTYGKGKSKTRWLHAMGFSPQHNKDAGLFPIMTRIRDHFLDPEYQKEMLAAQSNPKAHKARRSTAYDLLWAVEPHHAGINISKIAQKHASHPAIVKDLAEVNMAPLGEAVPELKARGGMYLRQWAKNAAITYGHHDQVCTTSGQVNVSALGVKLSSAIKAKGEAHIDGDDVPTYYTVVLFLSNPPPGWYEGKFVIYSTRVYFEGATYSALVLSAKHPHSSRGYGFYQKELPQNLRYTLPPGLTLPAVPANLPYGRCAIPLYTRSDAAKPQRKWLKWLKTDELPDNALVLFGTRRNFQEWGMRFFIKIRPENDPRLAGEWCEEYSWIENGVKQTPRLWIANICLSEEDVLDKKYKQFYQMTLATGCGKMMPAAIDEAKARKEAKKALNPNGEGEKDNTPDVKVQCRGVTTRKVKGKPVRCIHHFWSRRWQDGFCGRHRSQAPKAPVLT